MAKTYASRETIVLINSLRICALVDCKTAKKNKDKELYALLIKAMDELYNRALQTPNEV